MGQQLIVSMEMHSEEEVPLIRPLFPNVERHLLLCKIGRRANKVWGSPCPIGWGRLSLGPVSRYIRKKYSFP